MDDNLLPDNFEQVWARVQGAPASPAVLETAEQELEGFLGAVTRMVALYRKMLRRCGSRGRQTLMRLLAEERRHLQLLQLEFFLRTGDTFTGNGEADAAEGMLTTLRRSVLAQEQFAANYAAAARERGGALGELYGTLAEDAEAHAHALRELAKQYFI